MTENYRTQSKTIRNIVREGTCTKTRKHQHNKTRQVMEMDVLSAQLVCNKGDTSKENRGDDTVSVKI